MKDMKKLFLLDAYALIYRAYFAFAKNPRINSKGLDTSAIFGFANSLIEVINSQKPTHLAVVFDTKKPTQRHIEYAEYKAHREAMPEGISNALIYIDKLLEAFNIPKLYKDGYEADDIIGTIAKKAEKKGYQVFMMTPDKDFAQLVSENIFMYRPGNKWQPTSIWGVKEVLSKFKIQRVDQVVDFLGMMGDSADNIPGISGVGEKTAQRFINDYGSMENLFSNTHELKGKLKEKVENSKEIGLLSKRLVTIITDVPITFNDEEMMLSIQENKKVRELFNELEFTNLLKRINIENKFTEANIEDKKLDNKSVQIDLFSEEKQQAIKPEIEIKYLIFNTEQELKELLFKIQSVKMFSIEPILNQENKILGIGITISLEESYYIEWNKKSIILFKKIFEDEEIVKVGYSVKALIKALSQEGIYLSRNIFDIQLAHYLLYPDMRHALYLLSERYLNLTLITKEEITGKTSKRTSFYSLPEKDLAYYATQNSYVILQLADVLKAEMKQVNIDVLFKDIEMPLIAVLADMETEGINLDVQMLKEYSFELTNELETLSSSIHKLAGYKFNISSPKQMGEALFQRLKLSEKPKKTKSGQFSTSEEILLQIKDKHPIIIKILEYRAVKKLLSTYVDALPSLVSPFTNRLHTTFNQSVASTGRLSSVNPNLQNIPIRTKKGMKVREAFIPRSKEYTLLSADYSQIELRIMASLSQDKSMIESFNKGMDIHSITASKVYKVPLNLVDRKMRSNAKAVNFGIIYGISPFGLSQNLGISRTEAKNIIDQYFEEFPQVKKYMESIINKAREFKFVETLMGRRRYLPEINSRNSVVRSVAERNAINAPIQGAAADIIKKAMIEISNEMKKNNMNSKMLLQVHDELIFDVYNQEKKQVRELIKNKMENAVSLRVPLIIDIGEGSNWLEAH